MRVGSSTPSPTSPPRILNLGMKTVKFVKKKVSMYQWFREVVGSASSAISVGVDTLFATRGIDTYTRNVYIRCINTAGLATKEVGFLRFRPKTGYGGAYYPITR